MHRRRLLAALLAGSPLSGCVGSRSPGTPTPAETTTDTTSVETTTETPSAGTTTDATSTTVAAETLSLGETFESADGATATVHDVRVQRTVFRRGVHTDPYARPGEQFVVADASVSNSSASRDRFRGFSLVADGRAVDTGPNDALVAPFGDPAGELLGFRVPAPLDADRVEVVWTGDGAAAHWPLDADRLHALAHPPEFAVEGLTVPTSVERGSSFVATLTVANSGSGDGTFRAELGATTISDTPEVRVEVPADETVRAERTVEPYYPEDAENLTVRLNWGLGTVERTVEVN